MKINNARTILEKFSMELKTRDISAGQESIAIKKRCKIHSTFYEIIDFFDNFIIPCGSVEVLNRAMLSSPDFRERGKEGSRQ